MPPSSRYSHPKSVQISATKLSMFQKKLSQVFKKALKSTLSQIHFSLKIVASSGDRCPRFLTFPKLSMISHAQLWLLLFLQISLFIYFNLGHGPIRAKNNVNKQTNLKNNNNQSWAWLIMLNFGNVKNLGHKAIWHTHGLVILTKFCYYHVKIVDFLLSANFC